MQNLALSFDIAEEHFGIPQLLDPRDLVEGKPDELSVMTYVSEFFHAFQSMEKVTVLFYNHLVVHIYSIYLFKKQLCIVYKA